MGGKKKGPWNAGVRRCSLRKVSLRCIFVSIPAYLFFVLSVLVCYVQFKMLPEVIDNSASDLVNGTTAGDSGDGSGKGIYIMLYGRNPTAWKWGLSILFTLLAIMEVSHYFLVAFVDNSPGANPPVYSVIDDTIQPTVEELAEGATIVDITSVGFDDDRKDGVELYSLSNHRDGHWPKVKLSKMKHCDRCGELKPERCHHCSTCGKCCLKFDHHCPFFGNCVGFYNYKFFICFLLWSIPMCLFLCVESIPVLIWIIKARFVIDALVICLLGFFTSSLIIGAIMMFVIHLPLVLVNGTTYESPDSMLCGGDNYHAEGPVTLYDLGKLENIKQIFGSNYLLWLLPVFTAIGDGYAYPGGKQGKQP